MDTFNIIFSIFLFFLCVVLSLVWRKSNVLFRINIGIIIFFVGGYSGTIDLDNYKILYETGYLKASIYEGIYSYIAYFFHELDIDFYWFHFVLSALSILIIAYVTSKLTEEKAYVMALMIGFSTIEYAIQFKTLCAAAIIIYAVYFWFSTILAGWKKYVLYSIIIVLGLGFHFISVFFLLIMLASIIKRKYLKYYIFGCIVVFMLLYSGVFDVALMFIPELAQYVGKYRSVRTFLGTCAWQISGFIVVFVINRYLQRHLEDNKKKQLAANIYYGSAVMLLALPFYLLTTVAIRIIRIWSVFYYIEASMISEKKGCLNLYKFLMTAYSVASFILFYIILIPDTGSVVVEVLSHNMFY